MDRFCSNWVRLLFVNVSQNLLRGKEWFQKKNSFLVFFRNPTPASSDLPKWDKVNEIPANYYRIGNLHYEDKPLIGMESGGFFGERKKLWRDLNIYTDTDHAENQEL